MSTKDLIKQALIADGELMLTKATRIVASNETVGNALAEKEANRLMGALVKEGVAKKRRAAGLAPCWLVKE